MSETRLEVRDLACGYAGRAVLEHVSFGVAPGEFIGILGPNGTGKSTLLKTMARLLPPLAGELRLGGRALASYPARELARQMAYLPQQMPPDEGWRVEAIVEMGRFPFQRGWGLGSARGDREAIARAIARTQLAPLLGKPMEALSGGERQRVYLARALAQEAPVLLLDEPTSHLDMSHQLEFFHLLRQVVADEHLAVVAVLHDLNLAAQFCHRLLVLKEGVLLAAGSPDEVLEPGLIEEAFGMQVQVRHHPETGLPYLLPLQLQRRGPGPVGSARLRDARRAKLHVICGGGSGDRLLPELYRLGFELTVGVVNALDSDQALASRLGLPVVSEAPFSPISHENLAILGEYLERVDHVVVANVAWGSGNVGNLRLLVERGLGPRTFLLADRAVAERDFTGGEASALWQRLTASGASVCTERELVGQLKKRYPAAP